MPIPTWTPGQVLTAADVNTWFVPQIAIKPSTQSVTSSTAFVNDSALFLVLPASSSWWIETIVEFNAASGGDLKWTWAVPAAANGVVSSTMTGLSGFAGGAARLWTDTDTAAGAGTGTPVTIRHTGELNIVATPGNLQFRWAQNTSSATATTVMGNSTIYAQRIG